jgi:hypothetical protein
MRDVPSTGYTRASRLEGTGTYTPLREAGVEVIEDQNNAFMHHKFFVIDNRTVITGSYNPTKHANEENDENIVIIHNGTIAELYAVEFKKMWTEWYPTTPTPTPTPEPEPEPLPMPIPGIQLEMLNLQVWINGTVSFDGRLHEYESQILEEVEVNDHQYSWSDGSIENATILRDETGTWRRDTGSFEPGESVHVTVRATNESGSG